MFPLLRSKIAFMKLPDEEDGEPLVKESSQSPETPTPTYPHLPKQAQRHHAIILVALLFVTLIVGVFIGTHVRLDADYFCIDRTSNYCKSHFEQELRPKTYITTAPVVKDVRIHYKTQRFDGSLMHENIFRKNGSPAVDEAWQSLGVDCT